MALFFCQHRTTDPRAKLLVLNYLSPPIYSIVLTFKLKGSSHCPYIPLPVSRQAAAITPTFSSLVCLAKIVLAECVHPSMLSSHYLLFPLPVTLVQATAIMPTFLSLTFP